MASRACTQILSQIKPHLTEQVFYINISCRFPVLFHPQQKKEKMEISLSKFHVTISLPMVARKLFHFLQPLPMVARKLFYFLQPLLTVARKLFYFGAFWGFLEHFGAFWSKMLQKMSGISVMSEMSGKFGMSEISRISGMS